MKSTKNILAAATACAFVSGPVFASDEEKPFSYSYLEGAFVHDNFNANGLVLTDRDGVGNTADDNFGTFGSATGRGGAARLSLALPIKGKNFGFHLVSDYLQTSHDIGVSIVSLEGFTAGGTVATDQKEWRMALGWHTTIGKRASLFAEIGAVRNTVNFSSVNLTISGGGTASADLAPLSGTKTSLDGKLGMRALVTDRLELTGYARYHGNGGVIAGENGHAVDFEGKFKAGAGAFYHFGARFSLGLDYEFGTPGRARAVARVRF